LLDLRCRIVFSLKNLEKFIKVIYTLESVKYKLKLSAVRKVPETTVFQALGIIESKTVWETVLA